MFLLVSLSRGFPEYDVILCFLASSFGYCLSIGDTSQENETIVKSLLEQPIELAQLYTKKNISEISNEVEKLFQKVVALFVDIWPTEDGSVVTNLFTEIVIQVPVKEDTNKRKRDQEVLDNEFLFNEEEENEWERIRKEDLIQWVGIQNLPRDIKERDDIEDHNFDEIVIDEEEGRLDNFLAFEPWAEIGPDFLNCPPFNNAKENHFEVYSNQKPHCDRCVEYQQLYGILFTTVYNFRLSLTYHVKQ